MGLDMFLTARHNITDYEWGSETDKNIATVNRALTGYNNLKVSSIVFEAAYWRKANAIHNWFVVNVQSSKDDCATYYVSRDDLKALLNDVNMVLEDNSRASEILPTTSGFFFGGTEYEYYYFEQLRYTKSVIEELLHEKYNSCMFEYHSSWRIKKVFDM